MSVIAVVSGLQRVERWEHLERFLQALQEMEVLDKESAVLAGRIDGDLCRIGQRIGRADPMIAAQAMANNLVLVSGNVGHYARIQALGYPLRVVNWRGDE